MCSHTFLRELAQLVVDGLRGIRQTLERLFDYLQRNAKRTNLKRELAKGRLAIGLQPCR